MAAKDPLTFELKIAGKTILMAVPKTGDTGDFEKKIVGKKFRIYVAAVAAETAEGIVIFY